MDLARAVGLSAQTVRKYERWGFLPPSVRGPSGHRRYRARHLEAIRTARTMIAGYGWMSALRIMRLFHQGAANEAIAAVDACHAALHLERLKLVETLTALQTAEVDTLPSQHRGLLRVSEAAKRVGVRVSALRFWEEQGLLHPQRDAQSGYRLYDQEQVRRLQVVVLLRAVNYGFEEIRAVLDELAAGRLEQAVIAAEQRLQELDVRSRHSLAASAAFYEYLFDA